jgi:hypothetical protein
MILIPTSFREILNEMQTVLYGGNYQVTLTVEDLADVQNQETIRRSLRILYPGNDFGGEMQIQTDDEFKKEVLLCLLYPGDTGAGPMFTPQRQAKIEDELIPAFWLELDRNYPDRKIWKYGQFDGLPGYPVFWDFVYIITKADCSAGLLFSGAASD